MTFAFGSFTLGAALLFSAFKNQSLVSLILGQKGESVAEQSEKSAVVATPGVGGEINPKASALGGPVSKGPANTYGGLKIPKGTPAHAQTLLAKGAAKIAYMSDRFVYDYGGGHAGICKLGGGREENGKPGYDCSGCWSCVLGAMGILSGPLASGDMAAQFVPGPGKYITLYANAGHVWGYFLGVPFGTGTEAQGALRNGPAIGNGDVTNKGAYTECHPKGW